jgi:hypothetical protein
VSSDLAVLPLLSRYFHFAQRPAVAIQSQGVTGSTAQPSRPASGEVAMVVVPCKTTHSTGSSDVSCVELIGIRLQCLQFVQP